jgi:hypothetical protein
MKASDTIYMYIEKAWKGCKHAKTTKETDDYSNQIDNLYNILGEVSKFERSLIIELDVD